MDKFFADKRARNVFAAIGVVFVLFLVVSLVVPLVFGIIKFLLPIAVLAAIAYFGYYILVKKPRE